MKPKSRIPKNLNSNQKKVNKTQMKTDKNVVIINADKDIITKGKKYRYVINENDYGISGTIYIDGEVVKEKKVNESTIKLKIKLG